MLSVRPIYLEAGNETLVGTDSGGIQTIRAVH